MTVGQGPKISVLIVNYNSGDYLKGALESLGRQTYSNFEVIVVDNDSADGSADGLELDGLPGASLLHESRNHGFARGNNLAAARATGEWLALLNPDAEAAPDWLEQIVMAAQAFPDVVMFASTQISMHDASTLDGVGDCYLVAGIPWRGGFGRPAKELPQSGECFSPCGAGAVIRRDKFLSVGGFDERLFCYCEDVDLGFRLRLMGERCVFWRPAIIRHAGGGCSDKVGEFALWHGTRNRLWVFMQNMPPVGLALMLGPHVILTLLILLRGVRTGRAGATGRGLWAGVKGLGPVLASRKDVQKLRRLNSFGVMRSMSFNPFAMLFRRADVRPLLPRAPVETSQQVG